MNPRLSIAILVLGSLFMCCDPAHASPLTEARQAVAALCPNRMELAPAFAKAAKRYDIPPALLVAVARNESNCNPSAVGKGGEVGLMQLRPGTRAAGNVSMARLSVPAVNISLGARHLAACLLLCGDLAAALGVYSGRRTCAQGRASGYARRVLQFMAQAQGVRS